MRHDHEGMMVPARTLFPREEQGRDLTPQAVEALARQAVAAFWEHHRQTGEPLLEAVLVLTRLAGLDPPGLARAGADALFGALVERLSDSFRGDYCALYDQVFSEVIQASRRLPGCEKLDARLSGLGFGSAAALLKHKAFLDRGGPPLEEAQRQAIRRVVVLSRVTLGADVAISSVLLDGLLRTVPQAGLVFVGPATSRAIVAGQRGVEFRAVDYGRREGLAARLNSWLAVHDVVAEELKGLWPEQFLVIDPDTRLTQLGLLPVASEARTFFFPSRSYACGDRGSLGELAARWLSERLGCELAARPSVWLTAEDRAWGLALRQRLCQAGARRIASVSWGTGGDERKRIDDAFEQGMISALVALGSTVLLSRGLGVQEVARTQELSQRLVGCGLRVVDLAAGRELAALGREPADVVTWEGDVGAFCAALAHSDAYLGYDSAGQHIAAAFGVPVITVFALTAGQTHLARWTPCGPGPVRIVTVADPLPAADRVIDDALERYRRLEVPWSRA